MNSSRSIVTTFAIATLALSAFALTGCASQKSDSSAGAKPAGSTQTAAQPKTPTPAPTASMGVMNTKCPIVPDHKASSDVLVDFQGQKVALCCKGCLSSWNKLSDAEKAAKVAAAK